MEFDDREPEQPDEIDESSVDDTAESLSPSSLQEIVTYTLDWSVQSLLERVGTTLDINPSFQRRDAWSIEKKSLYIESLMLGLPVPQIVLAEDKQRRGRFIVLDGKQRLLTMKQFAASDANFPTFRLKKLAFLNDEAGGMTFAEMQSSFTATEYAEGLLVQPIRTIVVRNWRDPAILFNIFVRLNQGSLPLSPQELRQALYPNEFTSWVNERSANSDAIHRARGIHGQDFRMRDAEMLLRFVAYSLRIEKYSGVLRAFLDETCQIGQDKWADEGSDPFEDLAARLDTAIERTFEVFGTEGAFRRFQQDSYNRRFNIAVFDLMTMVFAEPALTGTLVSKHRDEIRAAYEDLCNNNPEFANSLQVSTKRIPSVGGRIVTFGSAIQDITGVELPVVGRAASLL